MKGNSTILSWQQVRSVGTSLISFFFFQTIMISVQNTTLVR